MTIDDYCDQDGIYTENKHFVLRRLREEDKYNFMKLTLDTSYIPKVYNSAKFFEYSWNCSLEDRDLNLSLFTKATGTYLGNLMLKNLLENRQEIGIDIVREYRRKGIGYEAVRLLMNHAKTVSGADSFKVRIYSDNIASIKLFKKLGAFEVGREDGEITIVIKAIEKILEKDIKIQLNEKVGNLFNQNEEPHIIVYELKAF